MQFQVTSENVRAMAERLQKTAGVKRSQAYEAIAQMLGHPNWDTLSGLLKKNDLAVVQTAGYRLDKPVELYIAAFAAGDYDWSPAWAKVTIDQDFLDCVLRLQKVSIEEDLNFTVQNRAPSAWQEDDENPRIDYETVRVGKSNWWFHGVPKHCDYGVETRQIGIQDTLSALFERQSTSYLAWRNDVLVYDPSGDLDQFVSALVDSGELDESYLPE